MAEFSLYFHIPFCRARCDYCGFYSRAAGGLDAAGRDRLLDAYTGALLGETERRLALLAAETAGTPGEGGLTFPTVYIGGGDPALLGAAGAARLLGGIAALLGTPGNLSGGNPGSDPPGARREITLEANPESADEAFLRACADQGVNRLSLGAQSFNGTVRRLAGRRGGTDPPTGRIAAAAEIFGPGLSLDLMSGLPGQSLDILLRDIATALSYGPGHISLYALTVEEGTPLAARASRRRGLLPDQDEADRLWIAGRDALVQAGYEQYEVSNFARREADGGTENRRKHNIRYWRVQNWLGLGPAASGTILEKTGTGRRVSYLPDAAAFLADPAGCAVTEELDRPTALKETLLMGFRYIEGPDPALFKERFGKTLEETIPRTLAKWGLPRGEPPGPGRAGEGTAGGITALDPEGLLFLNPFLLDAFAELDGAADRRIV
ncbi:MAG: coproporphyrinogen III oxidase family protein [Treponema sp.]|jgi:oxygen-independent coproporphyrinogen-3 oxidase|nr:coproporphyrinogen III oxidase family protein [Treponema sp.]